MLLPLFSIGSLNVSASHAAGTTLHYHLFNLKRLSLDTSWQLSPPPYEVFESKYHLSRAFLPPGSSIGATHSKYSSNVDEWMDWSINHWGRGTVRVHTCLVLSASLSVKTLYVVFKHEPHTQANFQLLVKTLICSKVRGGNGYVVSLEKCYVYGWIKWFFKE